MTKTNESRPAFLEFFAGSGLVAEGLKPYFDPIWANDICPKKALVYSANHDPLRFHLKSISDVNGKDLPPATLSWASFPCQDLSLAGLTAGIHAERSGLVWQWLRVMDEMDSRPSILVAENVTGLVSADGGSHYRILHNALQERGYKVGAVILDAIKWVPQSRSRVFVIAVDEQLKIPKKLIGSSPNWAHSAVLVNAAKELEGQVWWRLPEPSPRETFLSDLIDWEAKCDAPEVALRKISLIPASHRKRLDTADLSVAPGYKRTRAAGQVLELRFDDIAGCLRTAEGGSSRQVLVIKRDGKLETRLLTVRETARLMGAPETYKLPGSYNEGYTAMGDAVAVPVSRFLAEHLLAPLAKSNNGERIRNVEKRSTSRSLADNW